MWGDPTIGAEVNLFPGEQQQQVMASSMQQQYHATPVFGIPGKDPNSSQESSSSGSGSSSTANLTSTTVASSLQNFSSSAISQPMPILTSPSATKKPRLSPYPTNGGGTTSHRRHPSSSGSSAAPSPYIGSKPNGYRRNCKPEDLLSLEAPIQPRKYNGDSATSRKEVPTSVAKTFAGSATGSNKRSSDAAGLHPMDSSSSSDDAMPGSAQSSTKPLASLNDDPNSEDALAAHIKEKRRLNTLAARKTRQRKAQFAEDMRREVERLSKENAELREEIEKWKAQVEEAALWKQRAEQAEHMLNSIPSMGMRF